MRIRPLLAMGLTVLCAAVPAGAVVVPVPELALLTSEVPANGVVLFREDAASLGLEVTLDGVPVPGAISSAALRYATWRPTEPLLVGGTYQLAAFSSFGGAIDLSVVAVEAYEPAPHDLGITLLLEDDTWSLGGELACCAPPSPQTEPTCFETELVQKRSLVWQVASPLPPEQAGQYLYRYTELPRFHCPRGNICLTPQPDLADLGALQAFVASPTTLEPAAEYCIGVEARSLLGDEVYTTRRCVTDPGTELGRRPREDFSSALNALVCLRPPAGYEEEFCVAADPFCDPELRAGAPSHVQAEREVTCAGYDELCVDRPPVDESGCSSSGPPSLGAFWLGALSAIALAWRVRSRRRLSPPRETTR